MTDPPAEAPAARSTRSPWQLGTVVAITPETARASTFRFRLEKAVAHRAGQHFVLRLSAPDGYTAQRSYSVASAPDGTDTIDLTVERLEGGEVSEFLHDEVQVGDQLELRGPIGGWFVWDADRPAVLLGGGSGVVPLMAMLRLARTKGTADLVRLVVSVRSPEDLYYPTEIAGPETTVVYTRVAPPGSARPPGRLKSGDLGGLADRLASDECTCFVCGSAGFADAATDLLGDEGVSPERIRVERFGPSG